MKIKIRPYQQEAYEAILNEWDKGNQRTLLVLPTGSGKTITFAKVIEERVRKGDRVLVLAHRGELLEQAAEKIKAVSGLTCATEKAEETAAKSWNRVVVGSVQTLQNQKRLDRFPKDFYQTIVIDEAHHAPADSYIRILEHFDKAKVLGVTATPDRGDRQNLGKIFDSLAYEYTLPRAIEEGYLCKIKALTIPLEIDMNSVKSRAGDYAAREVGRAIDPYLEQIADEMAKICPQRKTVVFLPLIDTSQRFTRMLQERGLRAAEVNGESANRSEILKGFDQGKYQVLCNAMLLTEGWDCPSVDCIAVLRPTKVRSLYSQMIGRGTRLFPGKDFLLILDFLWQTREHSLCRPAHLIAKDDIIAQKMTKMISDSGEEPLDLVEAEDEAESSALDERENALMEKLEKARKMKRQLVDPLQFEMSIKSREFSNYTPAFGVEMKPPTEKQLKAIQNFGIFPEDIKTSGYASHLISTLVNRSNLGLATPKQIRFLERKGFKHVGKWMKDEATSLISRIATNHWRIPSGIDPDAYIPPSLRPEI